MAAPRSLIIDVEKLIRGDEDKKDADSPTEKKPKLERFPFSRSELVAFFCVFLVFATGLYCIYLTMPSAEYGRLKLPRTISDLRMLKDHLSTYAKDYPAQFILGYCSTYIFMQTFMIPGTIFMSLLAGALFGVIKGLFLVVFNATAGACSCYFLSKLIGRPLVIWLWPEKLRFFQAEIAKRREKLLNYMLFLRVTPTLPNLFINLASPIVDVPFHVFFFATFIGLFPAAYITVRVSFSTTVTLHCSIMPDFRFLHFLEIYDHSIHFCWHKFSLLILSLPFSQGLWFAMSAYVYTAFYLYMCCIHLHNVICGALIYCIASL
ncbi:hypothetical protein SAY87_019756 [Trapa incisa]|uniref:VTT domain-containing protein n=1 Tax=Trapa incisa TaxID=236973 RepID=A0AAN7K8E5_9MYRT|nr:hypothetical protein SAY87_019756 [Trapa incisa]